MKQSREEVISETLSFLNALKKMSNSGMIFVAAHLSISDAVTEHSNWLLSRHDFHKDFKHHLEDDSLNSQLVKEFVRGVISNNQNFSSNLERLEPILSTSAEEYFGSFMRAITFKDAFNEEYKEGMIITFVSLRRLRETMDEAMKAFSGLETAFSPYEEILVPKVKAVIKRTHRILGELSRTYGKIITKINKTEENLSKRLSIKDIGQSTNEPDEVNILFLSADPLDEVRLRLGQELREIQDRLQSSLYRDKFKLAQRMSTRATDISQSILNEKPSIVHFSGHGSNDGGLCFEDEFGKTKIVSPEALAGLFELVNKDVKCVILNACYSEIQATAIAKHIAYVIGMNNAIGDKAAIAFSVGFYQALGAGRSIPDAFKFGCVQIKLQGIPEDMTPVIIMK